MCNRKRFTRGTGGNDYRRGPSHEYCVGIQYIASWLSGRGAAPIYNLMEDAATAEISRAQVWQWIRHEGGKLNDGRNITLELMEELKEEELAKIEEIGKEAFKKGRFKRRQRCLQISFEMMNSYHFNITGL